MLTLNFVDFCDAHNKHISLTRTGGKNSRPKNVGGIPQKRRRCVVWRIETTDDMDDLAVNIMVMALNICILYSAFADKFVCGLTILKQDRSANRLSPICENKQKRLPPQKNTFPPQVQQCSGWRLFATLQLVLIGDATKNTLGTEVDFGLNLNVSSTCSNE